MFSSRALERNVSSMFRTFSTSAKKPTGIVMMNMGGPDTVEEVGSFLTNLFSDGEIITLGPLQNTLGPFIAKRRTPRLEKDYAEIGGSPIGKWTKLQGEEMCKILDRIRPESAPHKFYIAFRYANPMTEQAIDEMQADGVERAIAFSQYPQWSCTTAGSSLNHLWRTLKARNLENTFRWSVIDRWHLDSGFIKAVSRRIQLGLERFPAEVRHKVIIMFSAHSLPMKVVNKGDPYAPEVGSTANAVMQALGLPNPYVMCWQSQVGFLPWLGPKTGDAIKGLARQGHRYILTVPIAFTSDHIETLFEIDKGYAEDAAKAGISQFERAPSLNDEPLFFDALANIVKNHLDREEVCSVQYPLNCPQCTNPTCRSILNPIKPYTTLRDSYKSTVA